MRYFKLHSIKILMVFAQLTVYYFCLSRHLVKDFTAPVITSSTNELLGAIIASDDQ